MYTYVVCLRKPVVTGIPQCASPRLPLTHPSPGSTLHLQSQPVLCFGHRGSSAAIWEAVIRPRLRFPHFLSSTLVDSPSEFEAGIQPSCGGEWRSGKKRRRVLALLLSDPVGVNITRRDMFDGESGTVYPTSWVRSDGIRKVALAYLLILRIYSYSPPSKSGPRL